MSQIRVFMSFDLAHDRDLEARLLEESRKPGAGFEIVARSESADGERARRRIAESDEVLVVCGEHTGDSVQMSAEIRIAQEERKPYFLIWGRREVMCTRPIGARQGDAMYSWTSSILRDQVAVTLRNARPREVPEDCKRR